MFTRNLRELLVTTKLTSLSPEDVLAKKTSDTLFVMGSSSSLANLSIENKRYILKHDSIAFNWSILFPLAPTFYVGEVPREVDRAKIYFRNMFRLRSQLSDTLCIFKRSFDLYRHWLPAIRLNFRLATAIDLKAKSEAELRHRLRELLVSDMGISSVEPQIYTQVSSLDWILFFATKFKYKHVIMLGVDLNHSHFFYETMHDEIVARGLMPPRSIQTSIAHSTNDVTRCHNNIPIIKVVKAYSDLSETNPGLVPHFRVIDGESALLDELESFSFP